MKSVKYECKSISHFIFTEVKLTKITEKKLTPQFKNETSLSHSIC